jgi:LmbE family N-acetylglucosaminyl deacetylase
MDARSLPRRVLAVGAHPDDLEILCAGTMARYAKAGCHVTLCNATRGDRGSGSLSMAEIAAVRDEEARRSAALMGATYKCLGFTDGQLADGDPETKSRFIDLIRETTPDVVFTHHPDDYHSDHVATSKLVFEATFVASVPLFETSLPANDRILPVFYMDTLAGIRFHPDEYVDISETFELKKEMLACHRSQVVWMRDHDNLDILDFMETMSKFRGIQCGAAYAEGFQPARAWLRQGAARLLP